MVRDKSTGDGMYLDIPVRKAKATAADIEQLAQKYEPPIAKAVTDALTKAADTLDLDVLAEALILGDVATVLAMVQTATSTGYIDLGHATDLAQDAIEHAAKKTHAHIRSKAPPPGKGPLPASLGGPLRLRGAEFVFDRLNPQLIDYIRRYRLDLIQQIDDGTREGVRAVLEAGIRAGQNPRVMARDIKTIVGLTERQAKAVLNFRKELETFHARRSAAAWNLGAKIDRANGFQVFRPDESGQPQDGIQERRLRDFRYDNQLAATMKASKPLKPETIDKMVDAYARKYRKYRGETIARTESIRAANAGVQEGWRQAILSGKVNESLLRRFWKVAHDERECKVCNGIAVTNSEGVPFGAPFSSSKGPIFLPPQHPSCRCHVFIRLMEPQELAHP